MIRIMKTVIVFLFFALASTCNVDAQKPYVSMQECGNDTIRYIETNLRDNKDRYIGKPYGLFTNEFELGICIKNLLQTDNPKKTKFGAFRSTISEIVTFMFVISVRFMIFS